MKKSDKVDKRNIILLVLILIALVLIFTRFKFLYGSTLDWPTQHWSFAEYFRNLFYDTFNLFPSFAFNIGAGQNIYNLSYYGFLNPIILISYLLPFVKMVTYVMISGIVGLGISVVLFYKWMRNHDNTPGISFLVSLVFMCAGPMILHSHRHVMFVNYMPFLVMGLLSIDTYFKSGKRLGFVLSVFLIIMSSYFYSIPSLIVLVIYGVYVFLKKNEKITFKLFMVEGIKFLVPIVVGILMAAILLIPTLYTILNGRNGMISDVAIGELIMPKLNINYMLYGSYSIGLTAIVIIAIIYMFTTKKKENIFASIMVLAFILFPILVYVLNGFLYVNAKVLIPFLPLLCYFISLFLKDLFQDKVGVIKIIILAILISGIAYFTINYVNIKYYFIDLLVMILMILLYKYKKIKIGLCIAILGVSLVNVMHTNLNDELLSVDKYNYLFNASVDKMYQEVLKNEESVYRSGTLIDTLINSNKVYNMDYYNASIYSSSYNSLFKDFYVDVFNNALSHRNYLMLSGTNNILWDTFMGIKYVVTDKEASIGYQEVDSKDNYKIYENKNVLSIGYVNKNVMSRKEFLSLEYPYKLEALLNYIIVDKDIHDNYNSKIKKIDLDYKDFDTKGLKIVRHDEGVYGIKAKKKTTLKIPINEDMQDKILLIKFNMNYEQACSKGDTSITINGVKNVLTCRSWRYKNNNKTFHYVISSNKELKELNVQISKGNYNISDIETYVMDYKDVINSVDNVDALVIDKKKTKGDLIEGNINVKEDGYFTLSVPYDTGFKIYVDDKELNYELVNEAFIGFPLMKGEHNIKIKYTAPYKNISLILSGVGVLICALIGIRDRSRSKNEKREN